MSNMVSRRNDISRGQAFELVNKLVAGGLTPELAQTIIESGGGRFAGSVVRFIKRNRPVSYRDARAYLEESFSGPASSVALLGFGSSGWSGALAEEIPFSLGTILSCSETHILVFLPPASIAEIVGKVLRKNDFTVDVSSGDYPFANERGDFGWHLLRKTQVPNSALKTLEEQQTLLEENERIPTARVVVCASILYSRLKGRHLFKDCIVRTCSVGTDGNSISVGYSERHGGVFFQCEVDDTKHKSLGIASEMKDLYYH